ncbi:MAG: DEAD/DEAH box helicase [Flavobacteriales bacterium]|nr:DEAD/DEAH box helicase [Flavobacteriales bacterium]
MKSTRQRFKRRPNSNNSRPMAVRGRRRNNKKNDSSPNPERFIHKAIANTPVSEAPQKRRFADLDIDQGLKDRILKKGYEFLTEIQDQTIEYLSTGNDVMGIANTGSGKTAAFLIPVIQQLLTSNKSFKTLVLVPTRELALQVEEECRSLSQGTGIFCTSLIGGTSVSRDLGRLKKTNHIVVGTPGRVTDLIQRGALKPSEFSTFILDEFDRMLDMGFVNDVMRIADQMTDRKQTILFSATINAGQGMLIKRLLKSPKEVKVSSGTHSAAHIEQEVLKIQEGEDKFRILLNMIRQKEFSKVLVFAETKRGVSKLSVKLSKSGIRADEIHGNKTQAYRERALNKFKTGKLQVLVATDVAARGIDVNDITHVINYQAPRTMDSYIHRIGRTGRAGKTGKAITLIDQE